MSESSPKECLFCGADISETHQDANPELQIAEEWYCAGCDATISANETRKFDDGDEN